MAKVLRLSDRLKLTVGDVEFLIAPLSYEHKLEIAGCMKTINGEDYYDLAKAQMLYIKYGLKDIKGVEDLGGNPYKLEFENGYLTEDCISEIYNLEEKKLFVTAAWQLFHGYKPLVNELTGKKLEGVELEVLPGGKLEEGKEA